jgi:hypothetical protein
MVGCDLFFFVNYFTDIIVKLTSNVGHCFKLGNGHFVNRHHSFGGALLHVLGDSW